MYNAQYNREPGPDKSKCHAARALVEEAVDINHALNLQADDLALDLAAQPRHPLNQAKRQERTAQILLTLMQTYTDLEMFDQARGALKEAMALSISRYGDESKKVVACHSNMSILCSRQAAAIKKNMRQSSPRYSLGSRVLVEGLLRKPEYNGLEGAVVSSTIAGDSRICVRLDQGSKELRLKPENVHPLIATFEPVGKTTLLWAGHTLIN